MSKTTPPSLRTALSIVSLLPCLILLPFPVHSQPVNEEEAILLRLKESWSNPPALAHWAPSSSPNTAHCSWPEITCSNGAVTGIQLIDKNISKPIPPSICELKHLTYIDFQFNYIPGPFPTALYNCAKLEHIDLSQNYFVGPIPEDVDRLSPRLQYLSLMANNFSGDIPPAIGRFPELRTLYLLQNQFHNGTFPPEIGNLSNLEILELSFNDFRPSTVPWSFTQLGRLRILSIRMSNLIGEIPGEIGNLTALEVLDLNTNALTGEIPSGLFSLKNLTTIWLYKNTLSGPLPRSIKALNLQIIDVSENNLNGTIPDEFGNLTKLTALALHDNQFSGEIPESLSRLPALAVLRWWTNKFSGNLPPDFGRHSKLREFQISSNQFTGALPEGLCDSDALTGLIAFDNDLAGELPKSLGNCRPLKAVQVQGNRLSGEVPAGLWTSFNLSVLILSDNSFSGQLPEKIGTNLSIIQVANNRFFGAIPAGVSLWKSLVVFNASNNLFSGPIPQGLTALPSLTTIFLDKNQLSGHLPADIISWRTLNMLNLRGNQLSGSIPLKLGSLPSLTDLDLSENKFSGQVPRELGLLKLNSLNLSSNLLSGEVPVQFENSAFDDSFLNNSGLCAKNPSVGLIVCSSVAQKSIKLSSQFVVMAVVLAVLFLVSGLLLALFAARVYRRRKNGLGLKWKLTPFRRLDFTEMNILPALTEKNVIGSGGSGKVYRVPVSRSGQFVAVKKVSNKQKLDEKVEKVFLAEVEILGTIRHSNIVKLMCCVSSESSKLLVYEFLENRSLDRWLHGKERTWPGSSVSVHQFALDWPKRLQIAVGAARGLSYMHHDCSPAVIHRDVKSSNILLDSDFNAKIADFGLAKILVNPGEACTMSAVAGSFGYMAPEYAQTTRVNKKIDVYSFGVVLLELVTGREAHDGSENMSLAEWAWRHIQDGKPIVDALDVDAMEPCYLNEMSRVFELGVFCTGTLPSTRPSMKEVLEILLRCSNLQALREKNAHGSEYGAAVPLLKNSRRERQDDGLVYRV